MIESYEGNEFFIVIYLLKQLVHNLSNINFIFLLYEYMA